MLYDKRWDKKFETKADPRSLYALIAWLEMQPCDGTYDFTDPSNCLLARYLKFHGRTQSSEYTLGAEDAGAFFGDGGFVIHGNPGMRGTAAPGSWTFSAALDRARAALASA